MGGREECSVRDRSLYVEKDRVDQVKNGLDARLLRRGERVRSNSEGTVGSANLRVRTERVREEGRKNGWER